MSGRWLFFFCLLLCLFCFVLFFSFRMFLGKLVRYYCPSYYESCFDTCFRQQITVSKQGHSLLIQLVPIVTGRGQAGAIFPLQNYKARPIWRTRTAKQTSCVLLPIIIP